MNEHAEPTETAETDTHPAAPAAVFDPLSRRVTSCIIWLAAYGAFWYFGLFRPLPSVAWVNGAVVAAILLATLPPARVRPFTAAAALIGLAGVMWFVIHAQVYAIVLGVVGLLALSDGVFGIRGRGG